MYIHINCLCLKGTGGYRPCIADGKRKTQVKNTTILFPDTFWQGRMCIYRHLHLALICLCGLPPDLSSNGINHASTMIDPFSAVLETGVASYWFHSSPLPAQIPNNYRNTWSQVHSMHNEVCFNLTKCWCMGGK